MVPLTELFEGLRMRGQGFSLILLLGKTPSNSPSPCKTFLCTLFGTDVNPRMFPLLNVLDIKTTVIGSVKFPMIPPVRRLLGWLVGCLVGWSVCYNFEKGGRLHFNAIRALIFSLNYCKFRFTCN